MKDHDSDRLPMCFGMARAPGFCRNPTCRVYQQCVEAL